MVAWKNTVPGKDELYEAKREALLREAASAFNRQGFHATSLEDIAQRLGVTKAALYHYFPNKQTLLMACFRKAMDVAFSSLERARREGANGREKVHLTLRFYLKQMIDELSCCVVLMEENALTPADRAELVIQRDRFEQALRRLLREGIADGSVVRCDPKLVVFAMMGALNWVPKWFRHSGSWSADQLTEALTALFDRMISSQPVGELAGDVGRMAQQA
jgi:TetR/AcrR family transcriptional regulator